MSENTLCVRWHDVRVSENTHCVSRPTMFQKTNYMSEGTLCQRTYHVREHTMWSSENNILCQKTRRASNKLTCVRKTLCVRKHTICQTALFKFLVWKVCQETILQRCWLRPIPKGRLNLSYGTISELYWKSTFQRHCISTEEKKHIKTLLVTNKLIKTIQSNHSNEVPFSRTMKWGLGQ